jgi:hypothetical protein
MVDPALTRVLRAGARARPDASSLEALARAAWDVHAWDGLPDLAEAHGLAPLLYRQLNEAAVALPRSVRQRLFGLSALHREANAIRFNELAAILAAYDTLGIDALVLKGAALAHMIYSEPALRPLGDLDLLVDRRHAATAQATLADLGYDAPPRATNRRLVSHHHLPAAGKYIHGHHIQVEVHTEAVSRDTPGRAALHDAARRRQRFTFAGRDGWTLGHRDMLHHLCRHAAERAPLLRLIWVADVLGYAERFHAAIDWPELRVGDRFVANALALFHLVSPLPAVLHAPITPAGRHEMSGIGISCRPLTEALRRHRAPRDIACDVFAPSEWWLRLYYGLDERAPLAWHRYLVHPVHVARWLARRAAAYARWSLQGRTRARHSVIDPRARPS